MKEEDDEVIISKLRQLSEMNMVKIHEFFKEFVKEHDKNLYRGLVVTLVTVYKEIINQVIYFPIRL